MPTYEYKCPDCLESRDVFHKIELMEVILCEKCQKAMKKCFSGGTAVHFKGSGFWETDYKSK